MINPTLSFLFRGIESDEIDKIALKILHQYKSVLYEKEDSEGITNLSKLIKEINSHSLSKEELSSIIDTYQPYIVEKFHALYEKREENLTKSDAKYLDSFTRYETAKEILDELYGIYFRKSAYDETISQSKKEYLKEKMSELKALNSEIAGFDYDLAKNKHTLDHIIDHYGKKVKEIYEREGQI